MRCTIHSNHRAAWGLTLVLAAGCDQVSIPPVALPDLAQVVDVATPQSADLTTPALACPGAGVVKLAEGADGTMRDGTLLVGDGEYAALWSTVMPQDSPLRFTRVALDGRILLPQTVVPGRSGLLARGAAGYGILDCESANPGTVLSPLSPAGKLQGPPGPAPAGTLCPDGVSASHPGQRARVAVQNNQVLLSRFGLDGAPLGAPLRLTEASMEQNVGGLRLAAGPALNSYGVVFHQADPNNARRVDLRFCAVAADGGVTCRTVLPSFAWYRASPAFVALPDGYAVAVADSRGMLSGYNTHLQVHRLSPTGERLRSREVAEVNPGETLRAAWDGAQGRLGILWTSRWLEQTGAERSEALLAPCLDL